MSGTTFFNSPEVYLGHDLLYMASWLYALKDAGLSTDHHELAQNLYREIITNEDEELVDSTSLYRVRDWFQWVQEVLHLVDMLEYEEGVPEGPPEPPAYQTDNLFKSVVKDLRRKNESERVSDDLAFAEFS